jgi:hypothetical protein
MSKEYRSKAQVLKGYIRRRLIAKGKYTEAAVEQIFNDVTDNGKDLSEVQIVTNPGMVSGLNSILKEMMDGKDSKIQ